MKKIVFEIDSSSSKEAKNESFGDYKQTNTSNNNLMNKNMNDHLNDNESSTASLDLHEDINPIKKPSNSVYQRSSEHFRLINPVPSDPHFKVSSLKGMPSKIIESSMSGLDTSEKFHRIVSILETSSSTASDAFDEIVKDDSSSHKKRKSKKTTKTTKS
ncbi:hypothetical protein TRFO_40273 [Tritrichomonas foetus]|uniref:Uncharacterized protein n=1 Tax=Tritrichomonas foetus TaxID=1144522 RepID=A0A1J4J894_9EUKA|nr:hypothetical protein TRFO_40273 [Tritrichomonas foetus]|eukprot:OHS93452.1 hypothetical protein TRFO_40273 [Tritrichomonas foetus]